MHKKSMSQALLSPALLALAILNVSFTLIANAADLELTAAQPTAAGTLEGSQAGKPSSNVYIVQLNDPTVARYEGGIAGLSGTSNKVTGANVLDTNSAASRAYADYLSNNQSEFIEDCETAFGHKLNVSFQYQHVFNGVAVELSAEEAAMVAKSPMVKSINRERIEQPMTDVGPQWINADDIWGPKGKGPHSQGEDIVIAILDTGINSGHPAYADVGGDGYDHANPLGSGNYLPGSYCDTVDPSFCNDKLIGAWSFVAEAVTPEDSDGHGSHTSSTAGGNVTPDATLFAPTTSMTRDVSGVAPHANIIMYDVCVVGCPGAALLGAINQVVIDAAALPNGIHSLNFSIGGGGDPYGDPVEIGFLNATAAGVYVAASAGNAGPGPSTLGHQGPWVSTTAASTHNRAVENGVVSMGSDGGSLADISGLGFTAGLGSAPIINSADLEGAFPGSTLCGLGTIGSFIPPWPAGTFNGEIVACTRGTFGRVEKGANVLAAGAGGYILMDNGGGLVGDAHVLPAVHITQADGTVLAAWLAGNTNTVGSINGFSLDLDKANGDIVAGFSSRGPNTAVDVIKPDLTAPGVDILAAEAVGDAPPPDEYQIISGTSMSSPHNAGSGALLSAVRPNWTPYEIKSALMMTAETKKQYKEDGVTPADPFDVGAGRIDLKRAQDSALVLDETPANFLAADPSAGGDPKTLNLASMQDGNCVGTCSWTRTVKNVSGKKVSVKLKAKGPAGMKLTTNPKSLKLDPGESGSVTVTADSALAAPGWNFAELELKAKGPKLHMPIAVLASNSSDSGVLTKTVDAADAEPGDVLNYEINITNGQLDGVIDMTDMLPDGLEFVAGSESSVVNNGTTLSPFSFSGGAMNWMGELDLGSLVLAPSGTSPAGYLPLSIFGIPPIGCPGSCDEGATIYNVPNFVYNGQTYNQVIWSVNGTLEAGVASLQSASFANQNLPDALPPNNLMAPLWADLDMTFSGDMRIGGLTDGFGTFYTIYEWSDIELWGFSGIDVKYSFQIWVTDGPSGDIWFTYGRVDHPHPPYGATVGVENNTGTLGSSNYYNGAGVPPAVGSHLKVLQTTGGTAQFNFQAEVDKCTDEAIVNRADVTTMDASETAIAVTSCSTVKSGKSSKSSKSKKPKK